MLVEIFSVLVHVFGNQNQQYNQKRLLLLIKAKNKSNKQLERIHKVKNMKILYGGIKGSMVPGEDKEEFSY